MHAEYLVALVNPKDRIVPEGSYAPCENLAIAYLGAAVRSVGYPAQLFDGDAEGLNNEEIVTAVVEAKPRLLGLTCLSRTLEGRT